MNDACMEDIGNHLYWCLELAKYLGINNIILNLTLDNEPLQMFITLLLYDEDVVEITIRINKKLANQVEVNRIMLLNIKVSIDSTGNMIEIKINEKDLTVNNLRMLLEAITSGRKVFFHECRVESNEW